MSRPATLEVLETEREILAALRRYCRAVDRLDHDLALQVWHPGASVEYVDVFAGSAVDFIDVCFGDHQTFAATSHQVTNVTVEVAGQRAVSEAYVTATLMGYPDDEGRVQAVTVCGRYLDLWSQADGWWGIDRRTYVTDLLLEQESRGRTGSAFRRDHEDLSYSLFAALGDERPRSESA